MEDTNTLRAPWKRGRTEHHPSGYTVDVDTHDDVACVAVVDCYEGDERALSAILAAPDLLAELKNIANANWRAFEEPLNTPEDFVRWAQSRARAAIAKATASGVTPPREDADADV